MSRSFRTNILTNKEKEKGGWETIRLFVNEDDGDPVIIQPHQGDECHGVMDRNFVNIRE